jgi:hypothetical protein
MRRKAFLAALSVLLATAACGSGSAGSTGLGFNCVSAPLEEQRPELSGRLVLTPNPATPGETTTFDIGATDPSRIGLVGWGPPGSVARKWVGGDASSAARPGRTGIVVPGELGVATTMPAIGYRVPRAFQITVPDVEPGWHRISESGGDVGGHLPVEVVPAG